MANKLQQVQMYPVETDVLRFKLTSTLPYLATAIYRLRTVRTDGLGTFATDAQWRWYFDSQVPFTPDEQVAALYHEVQHLLRNHHSRLADREPKQWNVAGDCEINDEFPSGLKPSPHFLFPKTFGLPDGELAEWYYDRVNQYEVHAREDATSMYPGVGPCTTPGCDGQDTSPKMGPNHTVKKKGIYHGPVCGGAAGKGEGEPGDNDGGGSGESDGKGVAEGIGEVEAEAVRREVAQKIEDAVNNPGGRGNVPGSLARWAKEVLHPKVRWEKLLRTATRRASIEIAGMTDQTYQRPPRREIEPFIMPKRIAHKTVAAFYVDTSGSVTDDMLNVAMTEVRAALRSNAAEMWVAFLDAQIHSCTKVSTSAQGRMLKPKGRGGTDMRLAFDHAKTLKPKPNLIIVLTDGETPWPAEPVPGIQTIIVVMERARGWGYASNYPTPPWAKVIKIGGDD